MLLDYCRIVKTTACGRLFLFHVIYCSRHYYCLSHLPHNWPHPNNVGYKTIRFDFFCFPISADNQFWPCSFFFHSVKSGTTCRSCVCNFTYPLATKFISVMRISIYYGLHFWWLQIDYVIGWVVGEIARKWMLLLKTNPGLIKIYFLTKNINFRFQCSTFCHDIHSLISQFIFLFIFQFW